MLNTKRRVKSRPYSFKRVMGKLKMRYNWVRGRGRCACNHCSKLKFLEKVLAFNQLIVFLSKMKRKSPWTPLIAINRHWFHWTFAISSDCTVCLTLPSKLRNVLTDMVMSSNVQYTICVINTPQIHLFFTTVTYASKFVT